MGCLAMLMPRAASSGGRAQETDRLGWRAGTCIEAYGVRLGVRCSEPALLDRLPPHLPPGWRPLRSALVDEIFSLRVDGDPAGALRVLEAEMRRSVAARAPRHTFVHAGAVAWQPSPLTVGQAVLELLSHTVQARVRPETCLEALERAVTGALVLKGPRGDAGATAARLLEMLDGEAARPQEGAAP